uniref:Uncharacterized protein n=1 Tax=Rhizophora mucronata TaxID=61149 RepID=A0A2P2NKE7_RHIMU
MYIKISEDPLKLILIFNFSYNLENYAL